MLGSTASIVTHAVIYSWESPKNKSSGREMKCRHHCNDKAGEVQLRVQMGNLPLALL